MLFIKVMALTQLLWRKILNSFQDIITSSYLSRTCHQLLCVKRVLILSQKKLFKQFPIFFVSLSHIKIVFALLAKQKAIQIQFAKIDIRETNFEG